MIKDILAIIMAGFISFSSPNPVSTPVPTLPPSPTPIPINKSVIIEEVPFTVQAPFGEWNDPVQQDACEEASFLMAIKWARNETINDSFQVKQEIQQIAAFQIKNFGDSRDTSAKDSVQRIAKDFYHFKNISVQENIQIQDIIKELHKGNLVITPTNGQKMANPHFTPPGPERHMVLIIGYDNESKEFITNDTGISAGKNYRYPIDILYDAIRDYETGYHVPVKTVKKIMIVVQKASQAPKAIFY